MSTSEITHFFHLAIIPTQGLIFFFLILTNGYCRKSNHSIAIPYHGQIMHQLALHSQIPPLNQISMSGDLTTTYYNTHNMQPSSHSNSPNSLLLTLAQHLTPYGMELT